MGWANNSIYTTQENKEKSLIYLEGSRRQGANWFNFSHINFHRRADGFVQCLPTFGYSINCQTPTPGADTTDLVLRNFDNKVVGKVNNFMLTKNLYAIGTVINNTNSDPDGGNNPYWLCLHTNPDWGSILVRTWYTI